MVDIPKFMNVFQLFVIFLYEPLCIQYIYKCILNICKYYIYVLYPTDMVKETAYIDNCQSIRRIN
jgi:hypothetical protein